MPQLDGKVAIITGAAGGIGAATARLFAAQGAAVICLDLGSTNGEQVAHDIVTHGGKAQFMACNVADEVEVRRTVQKAVETFGGIDILVNVAGINRIGPIETFAVSDWDLMMAVNVRGMFLPIKHCVPVMRQRGGGAIVNMSSVSAFIGSDGGAAYHTTKGAVFSLSKSLALELAKDQIRVNALCPGWVDTPFSDAGIATAPDPDALRRAANAMHALGRMGRPEEIAQAALFLAGEGASFITGEALTVDGGFMIKK